MTDKLEIIARIIQPNAWPDDSVQMKAARLTAQKVLNALATTDVKALVERARELAEWLVVEAPAGTPAIGPLDSNITHDQIVAAGAAMLDTVADALEAASIPAQESAGDWVKVPREPTEDVVEAMARAVMLADVGGPLGRFEDGSLMRDATWEDYDEAQHDSWMRMARAALSVPIAAPERPYSGIQELRQKTFADARAWALAPSSKRSEDDGDAIMLQLCDIADALMREIESAEWTHKNTRFQLAHGPGHAPSAAIENLRTCQRQLDMSGCEVGVSREALDEALAWIAAMIAAAPSLAGRGWRPIESAPTDKAILGWRPSNLGDDSVFVITSIDAQWSVDDGKFEHWLRGPMPTHWQPLPPPPTKGDAG